jgi:protein SCO1/2
MSERPAAPRATPSALLRRALVASGLAAAVTGAIAALLLARGRPAESLPVLGVVPDFALTERSGRPLRRTDLDGTPWVADFVFTRCTGMCPALSTRMAELRRRAADAGVRARYVSFTVDPVHDTPAVLRMYAGRFGATGEDWLFVTGSREALVDLVGSGFRLSIQERPPAVVAAEGGELIAHSDRFVLVDGSGQIRGYYRGLDPETPERVVRDLAALAPPR